MSFVTYRESRNKTWEYLIKYNVSSLPVNIIEILDAENIHVTKNAYAQALKSEEKARSYYDGKQWHIVYDETLPDLEKRIAVTHELGHYALCHELKHLKYGHFRTVDSKPVAENQANQFAARLLCPACILHALDIKTPEQISLACRVDMETAKKRAKRMEILNKRNKFFTSNHELEVYENFKPFIEKVKAGEIDLYKQKSPLGEDQTKKPEALLRANIF